MAVYDISSAVLVEVEFRKNIAFGSSAYFDPVTPTVDVLDSSDVTIVADAPLIRSNEGRYFAVIQTDETWSPGDYTIVSKGGDGTYSDVTRTEKAFGLV